jgi:hypothetical protein
LQLLTGHVVGSSQIGGVNLADVQSNGKKMSQRHGTWVRPGTEICTFTFEAGAAAEGASASGIERATFSVPSCVRGKVLAGNGRLPDCPDALLRRPHDNGHLLILALQSRDAHVEGSLSQEQYCQARGLPAHVLRAGLLDDIDFQQAAAARGDVHVGGSKPDGPAVLAASIDAAAASGKAQ